MQLMLIIFLSFVAFASASSPTIMWIEWTTVIVILLFCLLFDLMFTVENDFVFDPDADNWRRKTE